MFRDVPSDTCFQKGGEVEIDFRVGGKVCSVDKITSWELVDDVLKVEVLIVKILVEEYNCAVEETQAEVQSICAQPCKRAQATSNTRHDNLVANLNRLPAPDHNLESLHQAYVLSKRSV